MIESGQTRRRWPRGTGSAGHTRCRRAACRRGGGGGGGAAVGRAEESERWRAGACSPFWVGWGRAQAGARRGGRRRSR
eukprot:2560605-Prymnesium_polylepis.1